MFIFILPFWVFFIGFLIFDFIYLTYTLFNKDFDLYEWWDSIWHVID